MQNLCFSGILLCAFSQARAQDKIIESSEKIIYRKNTSAIALLTLDTKNGRVGVNTPAPTQALEVNGKVLIRDKDEVVDIKTSHPYNLWVTDGVVAEDLFIVSRENWADHVFEKSYNLMSLDDLGKYIDSSKHLPDIPSAKEVQAEGYSQHDINTKFLAKMEELVLYTLQQEKELKKQLEIINLQKQQIDDLIRLMEQQNPEIKKEK